MYAQGVKHRDSQDVRTGSTSMCTFLALVGIDSQWRESWAWFILSAMLLCIQSECIQAVAYRREEELNEE